MTLTRQERHKARTAPKLQPAGEAAHRRPHTATCAGVNAEHALLHQTHMPRCVPEQGLHVPGCPLYR